MKNIMSYDSLWKSITFTILDEKHAAIRVSSAFHATSKISPLPLKLLTGFPSFTLQTYSWPAKDPLARYSPDGEKATEYTESLCRSNTDIQEPLLASHNLTDPSNEAVTRIKGFSSGFERCLIGDLYKIIVDTKVNINQCTDKSKNHDRHLRTTLRYK